MKYGVELARELGVRCYPISPGQLASVRSVVSHDLYEELDDVWLRYDLVRDLTPPYQDPQFREFTRRMLARCIDRLTEPLTFARFASDGVLPGAGGTIRWQIPDLAGSEGA